MYKIVVFDRLKIQPLHGITIKLITKQGNQNTNDYKRNDKLGYSSTCYIIGSKMGWVSNEGCLQVIDVEVILEN